MNSRFKQLVAVALLLSLSIGAVVPRRAEATFGGGAILISAIFLGGVNTQLGLLLGGVLLTSAASVSGGVEFIQKARIASGAKKTAFWVIALGALLAGGLILDGSQAEGSIQMVSLSPEEGARLGMTPEEYSAYESELPLINALNEEVLLRVDQELQEKVSGSKPGDLEIASSLHRHWQELARSALSPESMSAVEKIGARL